MKVQSVNGINFKGNSVNFKGENTHSENKVSDVIESNAVKVPVVVLLAMNPATLNAAIPAEPETNENIIVMSEQKSEVKADKSLMLFSPEIQQYLQSKKPPFGWGIFGSKLHDIKYSAPAQGNYSDYHIVYTANASDNKNINNIYLVKDGSVGGKELNDKPPEVKRIIIHNIHNSNNGFCSVITQETLVDEKGNRIGSATREIVLDDDTALKLFDLFNGKTKWKNNTIIPIYEVYDSNLMKPRISYDK